MEINVLPRIQIVGAGPGSPDYLTFAGRRAVEQSDVLVGAQRLLDLFPAHPARVAMRPGVESALAAISACGTEKRVAVIVSGDPGLLSLARSVLAEFGRSACQVIPGVSALQVAFARVALDWSDARVIDAHGAAPDFPVSELAGVAKAALFLGSARAAAWLETLAGALGSTHGFVACSNLTLGDEQVREVMPQDLQSLAPAPRTVLLVLRKDIWP